MRKRWPKYISRDDLQSYALDGLIQASKTWNPDKSHFSNWARICIKSAVLDGLRHDYRLRGNAGAKSLSDATEDPEILSDLWIKVKAVLGTKGLIELKTAFENGLPPNRKLIERLREEMR